MPTASAPASGQHAIRYQTFTRKSDIMRPSNRNPDQMRTVEFTRGFTKHAEGSVLVSFGDTRVICNADRKSVV